MENFDLRKYLAEGRLLKEEFVKGTPQYYVKYTTLDGKEVKSELMSKREAIYKERDLVDSGVKKSSVYKIQKNMDLNGKEYEIEYELDKDIEYRTDEEGKPIAENKLIKENSEYFHRGADGAQTIIVPDDLGEVDSDEFYDQLEGLSDGQMSEMDFEINKEYEVYMGGDDIIFKLVKQGNDLIIDKNSIKIE